MIMEKASACHVCNSARLDYEENYRSFRRVTSDCKPWPAGGELAVCRDCGFVQVPITEKWQREATQIYQNYTIYHQSGGIEQSIFDQKTGKPIARSARLLEKLRDDIQLPPRGRLLDIGCGNGQLLRNASALLPGWSLSGLEFDERHRAAVESIPGVEKFYTGRPENIPGPFDLITLVHVLEHLPDPRSTLSTLWNKLAPGGLLLVDVPDFRRNPFIILVADHCTHFSPRAVSELAESSGYKVLVSTEEWVPKEAVLVARKVGENRVPRDFTSDPSALSDAHEAVAWLDKLRSAARKASALGHFGIFGTSVAATFLYGELEDRISFFLDEDPHRPNKSHLGLPIYHPSAAPKGSHVFIPLAPSITQKVVERLRCNSDIQFHWL